MVKVGDSAPDALLIDEVGQEAAIPSDGTLVFLRGAFQPGTLSAGAELVGRPDLVLVLPDAPPIAKAWSLRVAPGLRIWCDHRPRGAVAGLFGFSPDADVVGLRVRLAAGRVAEMAPVASDAEPAADAEPAGTVAPTAPAAIPPALGPRPAATAAVPPPVTTAAGPAPWWPGFLATAAWVLVAVALARAATPGAAR